MMKSYFLNYTTHRLDSMIKKIRSNVKPEHKTVVSNAISLFILQGTNYILPLILFPYLIRVLGIENFGLLAFATATVAFLRGIVAYGFDLSGTQQIAIHKKNHFKLEEIFSSILVVKILLSVLSFLILLFLIFFVEKINLHTTVFLYTFIIVIGDALFPTWFFQGIEKMKWITYVRTIYKSLFVLCVVIIVKDPDDYILVPLFDGIGAIIAGIFALFLVKKDFDITFSLPSIENILFQFKNSWHIFLSQIAVHFYTSINIFVLGLMTNNHLVGYYSLAEKIYSAVRGLLSPVIQALFPFLSKKYIENNLSYYYLVRKFSIIYFIILIMLSILTYSFSQNIIEFVAGKYIEQSNELLRIFSITIIFAVGSFFSPLLIIKTRSNDLSKITLLSMTANLILLVPSIYFYGIYGLAYQYLIVQIFQTILQIRYNNEIWKLV